MASLPPITGVLGDPGRTTGNNSSGKPKRTKDETGPKFDSKALTFDVTGVQEPQDAASFSGLVVARTGTLAVTDAADAAAITGSAGFAGLFAATDGQDAAALIGLTVAIGALSGADGPDAVSIAAAVGFSGALAAFEGADGAAFGADLVISGTLGEPSRTFDGTGTLLDIDTVTFDQQGYRLIEPQDAASFTDGNAGAVEGALEASDSEDVAEFTGAAFSSITGTLEATEGADVASLSGAIPVAETYHGTWSRPFRGILGRGRLAATEAQDCAAFEGAVAGVGRLEVVEEPDGFDADGVVAVIGRVEIDEGEDTVSAAGRVEDWIAYDNDFLLAA